MRYPGRLRDDRKSLALALETRSEETQIISHATLDMSLDNGAILQTLRMPDNKYPLEYDALSSSLRTWSQRLVHFSVRGVVDESLFWPHAQDNAAVASLEWRTDEDEDHRVRNVPNEDAIQPLLEAWAKALARMPLLRRAKVGFEVEIPNSET
ncbi:hypothetical protein BKA67DRAFT_665468 [Truncatella angustata]|uniref:Uncharacterized protein n=1 Tax=Truncatella angustata TaxID=152316 RepID=A0A9P8UB14_9PEZI|nr:uncharacterized protein BKA67DRAFT_665468 [Truncatella angustata]KAH6638512.1 hypothetical protein BKA67DRAFT_665468 [Truncatella angustata]